MNRFCSGYPTVIKLMISLAKKGNSVSSHLFNMVV